MTGLNESGFLNASGSVMYIENSSFSENRSTSGNMAYNSSFSGEAIANNGGSVWAINSVFAYHYKNTGTTGTPVYVLNDIEAYSASNKIQAYNCVFHESIATADITDINKLGNTQYTGNASGSDNTLFTGGSISKILSPEGDELAKTMYFNHFW